MVACEWGARVSGARALQKYVRRRGALAARHPREPLRRFRQQRHGTRRQLPFLMALDAEGSAGIDRLRGLPIGIVESGLLPAPRIARAIDAFHRSGDVVLILQPLVDIPPIERRVGRIAERFPAGAGVHRLLALGIPLEQETGAVRDLSHWRCSPPFQTTAASTFRPAFR